MAVYLIAAGEVSPGSPVKIGKANNATIRLREFQCGHYDKLTMLRTWPGSHAEEAAMHRAFSEFHIRGEWFGFAPAMLDVEPELLVAQFFKEPRAVRVETKSGLIIEQFGGWRPVNALTGASRQAINLWRTNGIPFKFHAALVAEAKRLRLSGVTFETLADRPGAKVSHDQPHEAA